MLRAGNQYGKTLCAGAEVAMHLTGEYPDWWPGHRFDRPIVCWVTGETGDAVRDNGQRIMLGEPGRLGTGWIPKRCLTPVYGRAHGVSNLFDFMRIKHVSGGTSLLRTRYYEQGRKKWQGPSVDVLWCDEEPPKDIFAEAQARTVATKGLILLTFTPLLGRSAVVLMFLSASQRGVTRAEVQMKFEDALHLDDRKVLEDKYEQHEWLARIDGEPAMGSGLIYPVAEDVYTIKPFDIPAWWPQLGAIDFGYEHPTAAVKIAHDRDTDCVYVTREYRVKEMTTSHHAIALRAWSPQLRWAWPADGGKRERNTGAQVADEYRDGGLAMLNESANFPVAPGEKGGWGPGARPTVSVERGLSVILERLETQRLRVFKTCPEWNEERRLYHRKDGKVVDIDNDLMDATRYAIMMLRYAKPLTPRQRSVRPAPNWQA